MDSILFAKKIHEQISDRFANETDGRKEKKRKEKKRNKEESKKRLMQQVDNQPIFFFMPNYSKKRTVQTQNYPEAFLQGV